MTPSRAYKKLNQLLWMGRLPAARVMRVESASLHPRCYGVTMHNDIYVRPVILLNSRYARWGKTLMHEMVHVAEPELSHGWLFDCLVERYWRIAKKNFPGWNS